MVLTPVFGNTFWVICGGPGRYGRGLDSAVPQFFSYLRIDVERGASIRVLGGAWRFLCADVQRPALGNGDGPSGRLCYVVGPGTWSPTARASVLRKQYFV